MTRSIHEVKATHRIHAFCKMTEELSAIQIIMMYPAFGGRGEKKRQINQQRQRSAAGSYGIHFGSTARRVIITEE